MNKLVVGLLLGALVGAGATWFGMRSSAGPEAPKAEAASKAEEKPNPLHLPPDQRARAGLVLAKPTPATIASEVLGYAKVVDATTLATIGSELDTARGARQASQKELARVQKLFAAGGNASAQAVEVAQAAVARDQAAVVSAQTRLATTWGRELVKDLPAITEALEKGGALLRIDLLPGEVSTESPREAKLTLPGSTEAFAGEVLGPAPTADPQVQGLSYLALVKDRALPVGAALRATLPGVGEAAAALTIPRGAVVYHQGSPWIFVLGEEDTFERKFVTLGRPVGGDRIAVTSGLDADEQVVTTGAQQLLAAELQAGGAAEP